MTNQESSAEGGNQPHIQFGNADSEPKSGFTEQAGPQKEGNKTVIKEMCKLISVLKHIDTNVNGHEVVLSFCKTCKITRPPRTFHCSRCDACIEVHDHHCPWVGTCVGKRNHKYFTSFITYVSIHAAFTFATGLVSLIN